MTYRYRVTLSGIKGFFRVYEIGSDATLYSFHKQLRTDMEFAQDQLIMFKALDQEGGVAARYGLFDLGSGTVDAVSMDDTVKAGVVSFVYFYDVLNKKSVNITFEGVVDENKKSQSRIVLTDVKGPNPVEFENGYVAYEDLPDDQRHIHTSPSSADEGEDGASRLAKALFGSGKKEDFFKDEDEDFDDEDDEDDEDSADEDGREIFDGTEELNL